MSAIAITDDLFFNRAGLDRSKSERTVAEALKGGDDGELFLEFNQSEALAFDDGGYWPSSWAWRISSRLAVSMNSFITTS